MNLLLVDIGNTRIKWAHLTDGHLGPQRAAAYRGWSTADFARQVFKARAAIDGIVVASVAGATVERRFTAAAHRETRARPRFVLSERSVAGVTTAYAEPWRLGVDRFVAAIGAHHLAAGRAVCIINIGTAITVDLVDAEGRHRGGAIAPSPELMIESLLENTSGIRSRASDARSRRSEGRAGRNQRSAGLFARNTRDGITRGSRHAAAALVDCAAAQARKAVGGPVRILVTGGGAAAVRPLIRSRHLAVPDLVLRGLAILATAEPAGRRVLRSRVI